MGREIRRVPPNWEHPKNYRDEYTPLLGYSYEKTASEWMDECLQWHNKTHPDYDATYPYYWEYAGNPPERERHVPYDPEDKNCTWWQVYETVSEGTPATPAFATSEELIDYLCTHGDFWEQERAKEQRRPLNLPSRAAAEKFVQMGFVPSMMVERTKDSVTIKTDLEQLE